MKKILLSLCYVLLSLNVNAATNDAVAKRSKNLYEEKKPAVVSQQQIMLKVKIGEVDRKALDGFGNNIIFSGKRDINKQFEWLEKQGMYKNISESNLTTLSGEEAYMHIGGELPIPVSRSDTLQAIQYKQYGLNIRFLPVMRNGSLLIDVEPSLVEPRIDNAIKVSGMIVPTMTKSYAKTKVNLLPGETIMIAGFAKDSFSAETARFSRYSADVKKSHQKSLSEIVIIVTPYLVHPSKEAMPVPGDNIDENQIINNLLKGEKNILINSSNNKIGLSVE